MVLLAHGAHSQPLKFHTFLHVLKVTDLKHVKIKNNQETCSLFSKSHWSASNLLQITTDPEIQTGFNRSKNKTTKYRDTFTHQLSLNITFMVSTDRHSWQMRTRHSASNVWHCMFLNPINCVFYWLQIGINLHLFKIQIFGELCSRGPRGLYSNHCSASTSSVRLKEKKNPIIKITHGRRTPSLQIHLQN